jgi:hypothetical protein
VREKKGENHGETLADEAENCENFRRAHERASAGAAVVDADAVTGAAHDHAIVAAPQKLPLHV